MPEYHIFTKGAIPSDYTIVDDYEKVLLSNNIVNDKKLKASIRRGENVLGIKKEIPKVVVKTGKGRKK